MMRPALVLVLLAPLGGAQELRYELGLRVRAFEQAFEPRCGEVAVRRDLCPHLQRAVTAFFATRFDLAAKSIDEAREALADAAPSPGARWATSLTLRLESRFVALGREDLGFSLRPFYRSEVAAPKDARLRLALRDEKGKRLGEPVSHAIAGLPLDGRLPLPVTVEGDHRLVVEILDGETLLGRHEQTLSFAANLAARLAAAGGGADASGIEAATREGLARLLRALAANRTLETDYPAWHLLGELEALAAHVGEAEPPAPFFGSRRPGPQRLWLPAGRSSVPARMFVPEGLTAPTPLVVALHGAGGTENLFFEGYGAGKIVRLCAERGWLLVAPRSGIGSGASVDAIVDHVAARYPVDRERVFLIGHSMGAAQALTMAGRVPLAALAALGGSGVVPAGARDLPIFVAPGSEDFALGGARRLKAALERAGATRLVYREYEGTEHLGIVQVALADVFGFFDTALGK